MPLGFFEGELLRLLAGTGIQTATSPAQRCCINLLIHRAHPRMWICFTTMLWRWLCQPKPIWPRFPKLTRHYGSVKGAWPRIVEN